jgi:RimJ/RimL family protein N-acetyltransferase
MPWAKVRPTPEQSEAVAQQGYKDFAAGKDHPMRLWLKDGTFIGGTGFHRGNRDVPSFEIGYWCRTSFAGQGYISEAVETLCAFAFRDFGVERLEIRCDARNEGSRRVAEKCGFALEGILRHSDRAIDGTLRDTCIFARFSQP